MISHSFSDGKRTKTSKFRLVFLPFFVHMVHERHYVSRADRGLEEEELMGIFSLHIYVLF